MSRPTYEDVNDLLSADFINGKLYWKNRDLKYFKSLRSCNSWNTRYANTEAFTSTRNTGYRNGTIFGKNYQAHHILWLLYFKEWPEALDHINGIRDDNRIVNLREADWQENAKNMKLFKNNSTGKTGVSSYGINKYRTRINVDGKTIYIGCFDNLISAIAAREVAEKEYNYHINHGRVLDECF